MAVSRIAVLIVNFGLALVKPVGATMYQCESPQGGTLYTDRPTQVERCTPIAMNLPSFSPSGMSSVLSPPPYIPHPEQNMVQSPVSPAPANIGPEAMMQSNGGPPMPSGPSGAAQTEHNIPQPSTPSVSPLNPFGWTNCQRPNATPDSRPPSP